MIIDCLRERFPAIVLEECDPSEDYSLDVDYVASVGKHRFGLQLKQRSASQPFPGTEVSERAKAVFEAFAAENGGRVFVVLHSNGKIVNDEVFADISREILRVESFA